MAFIVEHEEEREGYKLVAIFGDIGHRCGYVGVPKTHPLYGLDYLDPLPEGMKQRGVDVLEGQVGKRGSIDVLCAVMGDIMKVGFIFDVHGSITYSGGKSYPVQNPDNKWWFFGFDCGHYGDKKDTDASERYGFRKHSFFFHDYGEVRTLDYVWDECLSLYKQLKEVEKDGQAG